MSVPFLDLGRLHREIRDELDAAYDRTLAESAFIGGTELANFEHEFAVAHDAPACVGCNSGTDALILTMRALGVTDGAEVVVPSMTFFATAEAVVAAGGKPIIADVDPVTLLLTPATVDAVRTPATRAVIPVHLYGHVVPFEHLREWRDQGLVVIEDAAQAHLATDNGTFVGSVGHAACFSFFPGKNLGALGDAGAVVTRDELIAEFVRQERDHGRSEKYRHTRPGMSSRLDGLQAAFLRVKLRHLGTWTRLRQERVQEYAQHLVDTPWAGLVPWRDGCVHHLLVVRVPSLRRAAVQRDLALRGIATGIHYPVTLARQPALASLGAVTPYADAGAEEVLSLPLDPLMTSDDVAEVCDAVTGFIA